MSTETEQDNYFLYVKASRRCRALAGSKPGITVRSVTQGVRGEITVTCSVLLSDNISTRIMI